MIHPAPSVVVPITTHLNINGIIKMASINNPNMGIGIPKDVQVLTITDNGDIVDNGETKSILWCHDCLYGSPMNCPLGIFRLCHGTVGSPHTVTNLESEEIESLISEV